ncbi:MAG TPA: lipoyl(octanoyl) transferase LipB [Thermoanaerobaculia bacterium]|nr:lipoyl(octanoyl) transferase LipB [Thermoanaerobaculia bacterium]
MNRTCELRELHRVTYENGLQMQQSLVALRQQNEIPDQLLLLEHPPVITLGRGGDAANLLAPQEALRASGIRFYETTRGGDITYHGPGQIVGYPLIHLGEGSRDIRRYVTNIEEVIIRTLGHFGIESTREEGMRGVWAGRDKVAAIGVRIARWVTSHGFALNVRPNLDHFRLITPCGLQGTGVTSIEQILGRVVTTEEVRPVLVQKFSEVFERQMVPPSSPDLRIVKVVVHDGEGRVLLLHRPHGDFWQPITGRIEPGESPEDAARREGREETGLLIRAVPEGLRQSFTIDPKFLGRDDVPILFVDELTFSATVSSNSVVELDSEEHDSYGWFTFEEACGKIKWSDDRDSLEHMKERLA